MSKDIYKLNKDNEPICPECGTLLEDMDTEIYWMCPECKNFFWPEDKELIKEINEEINEKIADLLSDPHPEAET